MIHHFYLDRKQTCWEREHFHVEADTEEEAQAEAIKYYNGESQIEVDEYESIGCYENMELEDNQGHSNLELNDVNKMIIENGIHI